MLNIKKTLYIIAAAAGCCLLPSGCADDDAAAPGQRHDVAVQLNVATRTVSETDATPTDDEATIHTLRVYAFVNGQPAGHYFTDNVLTDNGMHTFFMDLTFYSDGEQTVDFYAVANEAAMKTPGSGGPAPLSESTTETQLANFWFTELGEPESNGLPMFCDKTPVTLDFNKVKAEAPYDPDHASHAWLDYDNITFELRRPVGKLGVFAAKPAGETATLRVTGLTMLAEGTRLRNYLMTPTLAMLESVSNAMGDIDLPVTEGEVTATLEDNITKSERENPANYTPVLNMPFYPFENPWGNGGSWDIPGSEHKGNVLQIDYEFDGDARTGLVYMPAIERNRYYTVCCLMHNDGKITVEYTVADWDDEEYILEFDYPRYTNPLQPTDGSTPEPGQKYAQPTVWYNPDETSEDGSYSFIFSLTGPVNQKWYPTLLDATAGDFEVTVFQGDAVIAKEDCVASADPFRIRVRALKPENAGKKSVSLGISYEPSWLPEGSSLLLINGLTNDLKWEGSTLAELIVIKQTDVPDNY